MLKPTPSLFRGETEAQGERAGRAQGQVGWEVGTGRRTEASCPTEQSLRLFLGDVGSGLPNVHFAPGPSPVSKCEPHKYLSTG